MIIRMDLGADSYDIVVERGALNKADSYLNLNRRVLVLTDSGVPSEYSKIVAEKSLKPTVMTVEQGEGSKSIAVFEKVLKTMLDNSFQRGDCVVAVGGGVVGDLAGFSAACYMRGIDFYNIPTTLLSQVDSSIGGKTAVNLGEIKNIVGAFYQPKKVIVDPDLLKTLPDRQIANGLAEAVKMSLTSDKELFRLFENNDPQDVLDEIITGSLKIKRDVVMRDEKESSLRKVLNFGHTIGHAIETSGGLSDLYHGECVALGMLPMCSDAVRERLIGVLRKIGLPTEITIDSQQIKSAVSHDKKSEKSGVTVILVDNVGEFLIKTETPDQISERAERIFNIKGRT
ncbi:MAG: 3-dehydroquinate synthase [Clostridia bacterium]|nr:3-dehydroquinate synthase [Clostridia bacterium]